MVFMSSLPVWIKSGSLEACIRSIRDALEVVVMILVLSVLRIAPSGLPSSTKRFKKKSTSWWCSIALTSSTYPMLKPIEPKLSSPESPLAFRCSARVWSSGWILDRMSCNTSAAKTGEAGQPCEKPSVTGMTVQLPSSSRGCNGEMDQIFFPSKSYENQGSYQDSVEKE